MIDYITIMHKVILFINSAVTTEKINNSIDKNNISKVYKFIFKYTDLFLTNIFVSFIIIVYTIIHPSLTTTLQLTLIFTLFLVILMIVICVLKQPLVNKAIQECELDAASILPDDNISLDDIVSFNKYHENEAVQHFDCTMPRHFPVNKQYERGNLYDLPIAKLLETVNIKSTKNLLSNILYLNNYYKNNYVNDSRYDWINKQLNEFYNPTNPITNNDILKNLKN